MSDADAWLWLNENAAWKAQRRRNPHGQSMIVGRGQIHVSGRSLARTFRWDIKRVRRYLDRLECYEMILQDRDQSGTTLTICDYEENQGFFEVSGPAKDRLGTIQEQGKQDSLPKGKGEAPKNIVKLMFDLGVELLIASGYSQAAARTLVGKWRKKGGDSKVLNALSECQQKGITIQLNGWKNGLTIKATFPPSKGMWRENIHRQRSNRRKMTLRSRVVVRILSAPSDRTYFYPTRTRTLYLANATCISSTCRSRLLMSAASPQ